MSKYSFVLRCLVLLIGTALAGCSPSLRTTTTLHPLDSSATGRFTAGDGMDIRIFPDTASFLNGTFSIDKSGVCFLPVVGNVYVLSMTPAQLTLYLQRSLEKYLRYPEIQIRPVIRVDMSGGFVRPGYYYIGLDRSMWDLINSTGGMLNEDGAEKLLWKRDRRIITDNLIPAIQSGDPLWKIGFQSGDRITTPSEHRDFIRDVLVGQVIPLVTFAMTTMVSVLALTH